MFARHGSGLEYHNRGVREVEVAGRTFVRAPRVKGLSTNRARKSTLCGSRTQFALVWGLGFLYQTTQAASFAEKDLSEAAGMQNGLDSQAASESN